MASQHPYYPPSLDLPGFVPASLSQQLIVGVFAAYSFIVIAFGWSLSGRYKYLSSVERALVCWWLFTGFIHLILEGYFVITPDFFRLPYTNFLAETWKEYGKGDSRYPARDVTIVVIEGLTAFIEGPASLLAVYAIIKRKPYQHALQLATSLGELYGDILYFTTVYFLKEEISAPGHVYFWGYFIFMNSIWIVIPSFIVVRSWNHISNAFVSKSSNAPMKKIE